MVAVAVQVVSVFKVKSLSSFCDANPTVPKIVTSRNQRLVPNSPKCRVPDRAEERNVNHVTESESRQSSAYPRTYRRYLRSCGTGSRKRVRLYVIWESMKQRCHYPRQKAYPRYGARGISVCSQWRDDYDAFRAWAIGHGYTKHVTLDRIDNTGNYEPENCRWIPAGEQQWNTRATIHLTLRGVTKPLPQWAAEIGVSPFLLRSRRSNGWSDEQILTTPVLPTGIWREGVQHGPRGRRPSSVFSAKGDLNG